MQGLAVDKFFYFVMGLRKGEIRKRVDRMKARYPGQSPEELARHFIHAQAPLSVLAGALMHAPILVPALGPALKVLGMAGGTAVMMKINMALMLEIATLFGHDIDEHERVKEMGAVMALTGLSSGTSMIPEMFSMKPHFKFLAGGLTVVTVSQLIGEAAIRYYGGSRSKLASAAS